LSLALLFLIPGHDIRAISRENGDFETPGAGLEKLCSPAGVESLFNCKGPARTSNPISPIQLPQANPGPGLELISDVTNNIDLIIDFQILKESSQTRKCRKFLSTF
jgi:hypothetical protein